MLVIFALIAFIHLPNSLYTDIIIKQNNTFIKKFMYACRSFCIIKLKIFRISNIIVTHLKITRCIIIILYTVFQRILKNKSAIKLLNYQKNVYHSRLINQLLGYNF